MVVPPERLPVALLHQPLLARTVREQAVTPQLRPSLKWKLLFTQALVDGAILSP